MLYVRGSQRDYDRWVKAGNYGWRYEEVLSYFPNSENNSDPEVLNSESVSLNTKSHPGSKLSLSADSGRESTLP